MNVGSLFAGIGGFDLGFKRCGMRTVWQVEQNEFCQAVLAKHFPDAERFDDVCTVGAHNLKPVDLICGGFPCQDISLAGKGGGLDGARSGLWSEYARIVGELEPRWVVVENVPALTSRGLDRVLRDLAALGYDAEWDCIPASALGAPHRRDRIWVVAYPGGHRCVRGEERDGKTSEGKRPAPLGGDPDRCLDLERRHGAARDCAPPRPVADASGVDEARAVSERDPGRRSLRTIGDGSCGGPGRGDWAIEPDVGRVAHGISDRLDRLSALGNALVPQIAEWIGRRILTYEKGGVS